METRSSKWRQKKEKGGWGNKDKDFERQSKFLVEKQAHVELSKEEKIRRMEEDNVLVGEGTNG